MKTISMLALVCALSLPAACFGEEKSPPLVVVKGFQAFQENGLLAALNIWLAGSARESDDNFQDVVRAKITQTQGLFGKMSGFETIRVVNLSPSTLRLYVAVKFEKGVAWMRSIASNRATIGLSCGSIFKRTPTSSYRRIFSAGSDAQVVATVLPLWLGMYERFVKPPSASSAPSEAFELAVISAWAILDLVKLASPSLIHGPSASCPDRCFTLHHAVCDTEQSGF